VEEIGYIATLAIGTAITSLAGLAQGRQSRKLLEKQHAWALEDLARQAAKSTESNEKVITAVAVSKNIISAAIADNTSINTKALNAANGVTDKLADMISFTGGVEPVDAARVLISIQQTIRLLNETVEAQKKYAHESIHEINRSLALLIKQVGILETASVSSSVPKEAIGGTVKPTEV
jgi:hypothetical protein